ncbi:LysR family transcriptional regulator [Marimonas arenosa]|uniref:LysR family transcriptional regulator n=1 Tax=Marimonas arenosa TaxID=1795305 RepID=A0AAE3WE94_9RHOB|nr:LysR family transcriptional regulator [Marimonas arenosa]MDQ2090795.1 LysR family transcriptional regulator [Marimonas arenosa]
MHFTLKQLRYFDAALRIGSIARAAAEMNISQSSITAAIDSIEQDIGTELFRRIPAKGLIPTDTGQRVGQLVTQFLEQARMFESDLMSLSGGPAGTLRLACYAPTAPYVLPPLLKRVARDYPEIRIDLQEGDMHSINTQLKSGTVDLALTYRRETPEKLPFTPLFRARPWALLPANSPLSQQPAVRLADLAPLPMIMLDLPGTETYFLSIFSSHGLRPDVVHTTKSSSVLRGLVAAEFGYSILNICGPNDRDGRNGIIALPISDEIESPRFGVACTHAAQRAAMVQAVTSICEELSENGAFDHLILRDPT